MFQQDKKRPFFSLSHFSQKSEKTREKMSEKIKEIRIRKVGEKIGKKVWKDCEKIVKIKTLKKKSEKTVTFSLFCNLCTIFSLVKTKGLLPG